MDENADVAESLGTLVASWGCTVRSAYTAGKALAIAAEFAPTVVLLDLGLPDLHGYDLAKQLRKEAAGRPLYCIAVSGWYQIADQLQSAAAGISHHLVKPVNLDVLREILSKYQSLQAQ